MGATNRVVCIEDEPEMIDLVRLILSRKGFQVVGAMGGREGLEVIAREKPDLVLLDLMMPDMDGWEVYQKMKANEAMKNIPVIVVTGRSDPEEEATVRELGITAFLRKPPNGQQILSALSVALD